MTWLAKPPLVRILKGVAAAWLVASAAGVHANRQRQ